jgi:hypothetical protein
VLKVDDRRRLQMAYCVTRLAVGHDSSLMSTQAQGLLQQARFEMTMQRLTYAVQKLSASTERLGHSLDRLADQLDDLSRRPVDGGE